MHPLRLIDVKCVSWSVTLQFIKAGNGVPADQWPTFSPNSWAMESEDWVINMEHSALRASYYDLR